MYGHDDEGRLGGCGLRVHKFVTGGVCDVVWGGVDSFMLESWGLIG